MILIAAVVYLSGDGGFSHDGKSVTNYEMFEQCIRIGSGSGSMFMFRDLNVCGTVDIRRLHEPETEKV